MAPQATPPWGAGAVQTAPPAAARVADRVPPAPPLERPEPVPGAGSAPPTGWPPPTLSHRAASTSSGRSPVAMGLLGLLVGALAVGLVFAGYAFGHQHSPSRVRTRVVRTGDALDIHHLLEIAQPSVVSLLTGKVTTGFDSAGSGVVITANGFILTNNHVIAGAKVIRVQFNDGTVAPATLVGAFPSNDIAMLRVDRTDLTPARLGRSSKLEVGDDVLAIGNAFNLGGPPSVTRGIVSATERTLTNGDETLEHLIQTDAAINPGNSGGPLVNADGQVVGINTEILRNAQNIGFSISIDSLRGLIRQMEQGKGAVQPDLPFLGVETVDVTSPTVTPAVRSHFGVIDASGAFVEQVTPSTAAADAGLEQGDVIIEIDGQQITDSADVGDVIGQHAPGDQVTIVVDRAGRTFSFQVTLRRRGG